MLNLDEAIYTALSGDAQLNAVLPGGVFYSPNDFPVNPDYPLILFETKTSPSDWGDDAIAGYKCDATIHCMSTGDLNVIMGHVERIMTGIGFVFVGQGNGTEPDCYRRYMNFTITKEA